MVPVAYYEDKDASNSPDGHYEYEIVNKFIGKLFISKTGHSPFDVVAWHGKLIIVHIY